MISMWRWTFNQKLCIENIYVWRGGGIQSKSFMGVGSEHPQFSARHWLGSRGLLEKASSTALTLTVNTSFPQILPLNLNIDKHLET